METIGFKAEIAVGGGGASGMGNAVVKLLNEAGCRVHVFYIKETADGFSITVT